MSYIDNHDHRCPTCDKSFFRRDDLVTHLFWRPWHKMSKAEFNVKESKRKLWIKRFEIIVGIHGIRFHVFNVRRYKK